MIKLKKNYSEGKAVKFYIKILTGLVIIFIGCLNNKDNSAKSRQEIVLENFNILKLRGELTVELKNGPPKVIIETIESFKHAITVTNKNGTTGIVLSHLIPKNIFLNITVYGDKIEKVYLYQDSVLKIPTYTSSIKNEIYLYNSSKITGKISNQLFDFYLYDNSSLTLIAHLDSVLFNLYDNSSVHGENLFIKKNADVNTYQSSSLKINLEAATVNLYAKDQSSIHFSGNYTLLNYHVDPKVLFTFDTDNS